jgi:CelD/BcsL family acetyltransferase involved in cellulose biosynthesis
VSQVSAAVSRHAEPPPSVSSTPAARLAVEVKRDLDLRSEDAASLAALLESRPSVAVFLSNAWLSGFFAEPPAGFEPSLVLFREGSTLRGVVPIAVRHTLGHVRVALLGGGAGSDRTDLIAARAFEAACADSFLSWLAETFGKGFVLELRDVPADSALWGGVYRASTERSMRLTLQPREVHTLPFLDLAELWSSGLGPAPRPCHPRSLDKHRRWLERRGRLRIERLEDPGEVMDAFASLAQFLHARWGNREGGSVLDNPRALRFHRHVLPLLLKDKRLRMIRLSADTRTIAVFYGVASGTWSGYCLAGYDREWAGRIHLGQITLATAIDLAAQEGATEFDFLKGAHRTKYLWPVRERATLDAEVYSEKFGPQLARAAWATREAAAAFGKSALSVFSK